MNSKRREDVNGGLILIAVGLVFLVSRFVDFGDFGDNFGLWLLPGLGAIFMIAGILKREAGLMIPGGILSGIGLGSYLIAGPFEFGSNVDDGGLFMLAFAAGFASITFFTAVFAKETHWWALIPASIMAIIGLGISLGGIFFRLLELAGTYWPVILIVVGGYSILKALQTPAIKEKQPDGDYV